MSANQKKSHFDNFNNIDQHTKLFALALPMILSNVTVPLLGLVDTAVIGHLDHAYYLGGSSVGAMIITAIVWFCGFLRMSTTGLAAQAYGAANVSNNLNVLARGLVVALVLGVIFILFQVPFLDLSISMAEGSEQVQFYARQYAEIRVWGFPAALANLVILGWLLGNHQAKKVMWILIVTNLLNLVLDIVFVVGFNWQIKGLASATLITEYVSCCIGLYVIATKYSGEFTPYMTDLWKNIKNRAALMGYFSLNRDIVIRTLCLEICFIFITFEGAKLGDEIVAANAILLNFLLLISFGLDGIANAAEAMVGSEKGSKSTRGILAITHIGLFWTFMFALLYSLLFYMMGESFIGMMTSIEPVIALSTTYLPWLVLLPLLACWCYLFDGIYIGLMNVSTMRNSMIIATFGCFFPVWFLLEDYNNHGLWAAFSIFMLVRGVTLALDFYMNKRYKMSVVASNSQNK